MIEINTISSSCFYLGLFTSCRPSSQTYEAHVELQQVDVLQVGTLDVLLGQQRISPLSMEVDEHVIEAALQEMGVAGGFDRGTQH